jgi:FlaA1/EpsC-like NDP-sugar epimerase
MLSVFEKYLFRPLLPRFRELRNRHFLLADAAALVLMPALALLLRVEAPDRMVPHFGGLALYTLIGLAVRLCIFHRFGLYRRYWRYATVEEMRQIFLAVFFSIPMVCVIYALGRMLGIWDIHIPRSLPLIDGLLMLLAVGATRFSIRLAEQSFRKQPQEGARRVLVIGAGVAGQMIVRELQSNPQLGLEPVAFLDDDVYKQGVRILDLPVAGGRNRLPEAVARYEIGQVIIATPRAPGQTIRELVALCEEAGVQSKTVPGMHEILGGTVSVTHLRNVQIEDLLRREPIQTDILAVQDLIRGKRVLVTGGGGSIGSELCRQVLRCEPAHLALLGHGENSVFETHNELLSIQHRTAASANGHPPVDPPGGYPRVPGAPAEIRAFIADIRSPERMRSVIQEFRPDIIFHAAAHKHVPLMEMNPVEAISNNVLGTRNVLEAALAADVDRFVMISTDKAVNPTSIMGASKRAAELLVLRAARQSGKPYVAVRFGNVLGSRGSVVLTFKRQIASGGPVTVSHPDMRRYFMTIPEAVQLVLQASVLGHGGEIFVLDMGKQIKIVDLARDLIELSGLEVGRDIDIVYSGVRPGEKLYEELFLPDEHYRPTYHEKILIAGNASSFVPRDLDRAVACFQAAVAADDGAAAIRSLSELVPEYHNSLQSAREAGKVLGVRC